MSGEILSVDNKTGTSSAKGKFKLNADWVCAAFILLIVVAFFAKTVFLGHPISKICRLAAWDSVFFGNGAGTLVPCDPSVVQLLVPTYFLVAKIWAQGQLPLWNPYCGFGAPLVGDIQATVFSPVRFFFDLFPTMYVYNLTIVGEVAAAALGMFALGRTCGLTRYASVFSALSYGLCPYFLWYLELMSGTSQAMFPLCLCLFARLGKNPTWVNSLLCGLGAAGLILSGHPESSLYGIGFGSVLTCLMILSGKDGSFGKKLVVAVRGLAGSGLMAFCLAAPVLLPFAEFLGHADSYKYAGNLSAYAPWHGLVYNLLQPGLGAASPYLGVLAVGCVFLAFLRKGEMVKVLSTLALFALFICDRLGPLHDLWDKSPLRSLITVYVIPIFLIFVCLIAAFGLVELVERRASVKTWLVLGLGIAATFIVPLILHLISFPLARGDFDMILPAISFDLQSFKRDLMLALLLIGSVVFCGKFFPKRSQAFVIILCLAINFVSQACLAKSSLPIESAFSYPLVQPLDFLQSHDGRLLAFGDHVFRADTNVVYGIKQIQSYNPLYPKGYLNFIKACGADASEFSQTFSKPLSPLLDLAAVRYVISALPISAVDEPIASGKEVVFAGMTSALPALKKASVAYDAGGRAIVGDLAWVVPASGKYAFTLSLADGTGNVIWFGDQHFLDYSKQSGGNLVQGLSVPVPELNHPGKLVLSVALFDLNAHKFLSPALVGANGVIASFDTGDFGGQNSPRHYQFVMQAPSHVRVYKNRQSVGDAYVVHDALLARSDDEALSLVKSERFDCRHSVILLHDSARALSERAGSPRSQGLRALDEHMADERGGTRLPGLGASGGRERADFVLTQRPDCNSVTVDLVSRAPGYLVLTDAFYPGWVATVDHKPVQILKANYCFRAVPIDAGAHKVEFRYRPVSFVVGMLLFCFGTAALLYAIRLRFLQSSRGSAGIGGL